MRYLTAGAALIRYRDCAVILRVEWEHARIAAAVNGSRRTQQDAREAETKGRARPMHLTSINVHVTQNCLIFRYIGIIFTKKINKSSLYARIQQS